MRAALIDGSHQPPKQQSRNENAAVGAAEGPCLKKQLPALCARWTRERCGADDRQDGIFSTKQDATDGSHRGPAPAAAVEEPNERL